MEREDNALGFLFRCPPAPAQRCLAADNFAVCNRGVAQWRRIASNPASAAEDEETARE
jgi:hypothetical protein